MQSIDNLIDSVAMYISEGKSNVENLIRMTIFKFQLELRFSIYNLQVNAEVILFKK